MRICRVHPSTTNRFRPFSAFQGYREVHLRTLNSALAKTEELMALLLMAAMTTVVFVAVVLRYAFNSPIGWSDELAKICFTWLVFIGGAVGVRRGAHISIDAAVAWLPARPRKVVAFVADALVAAVLAVFIYYGALLVQMTFVVTTPSLRLPVGMVYAAAPIGSALMLLHQLQHIAVDYFGVGAGTPAREGVAK